MIQGSILGVLPFTLALPFASFPLTIALTVPIDMILASAMPAILVYGQELLPGRVGLVGRLSFGLGRLRAVLLGEVVDQTSIGFICRLCAFLPVIDLFAEFLPRLHPTEYAHPSGHNALGPGVHPEAPVVSLVSRGAWAGHV